MCHAIKDLTHDHNPTGDVIATHLPGVSLVTGDDEPAMHPLWVDVHSCGCVRVGTLANPLTYDSIDAARDAHDFTLCPFMMVLHGMV